jgi:hypothetical protein
MFTIMNLGKTLQMEAKPSPEEHQPVLLSGAKIGVVG